MVKCELKSCSVKLSDFTQKERIGSGAQGIVHVVEDLQGKKFCSKKLLLSASLDAEVLAISKSISSLYVVDYHHHFKNDEYDVLIMEYCEGGSLQDLIDSKVQLSNDDKWQIFTQLVHALDCIHSLGVLHRDIKPSNVLLVSRQRPYRIKLTDFGMSRDLNKSSAKSTVGTELFMPPEMFDARPYGTAVDVWALGVMLYLLVENKYPFSTLFELFRNEAPTSATEFGELIASMLNKDPSKRPTVEQLQAHPKIREIHEDYFACSVINNDGVIELRREIRVLKEQVVSLESKVKSLEQSSGVLLSQLNDFAENLKTKIDAQMSGIEGELKKLNDELSLEKQKTCKLESELAEQKSVTGSLTSEMNTLKQNSSNDEQSSHKSCVSAEFCIDKIEELRRELANSWFDDLLSLKDLKFGDKGTIIQCRGIFRKDRDRTYCEMKEFTLTLDQFKEVVPKPLLNHKPLALRLLKSSPFYFTVLSEQLRADYEVRNLVIFGLAAQSFCDFKPFIECIKDDDQYFKELMKIS
ncbi:hypothetical protein RCL1_006888 [Eukaryota sp. TZLM3-RCL]